jgi:hypothetical protein
MSQPQPPPTAPPRGKSPVDFDDLFPGRYLKAGQLGDKRPSLTIADVQMESLPDDEGGERMRGVMFFQEIKYALVVNKTNALCLRAMFGRDVRAWKGHKVTLYRGEHAGEPAVRIWGSPELTAEVIVQIKLPKRRPSRMTMHVVQASGTRPDVDPHPTDPG